MTRHGLLVDWGGVLTTSPYTSFTAFCAAEGLAPDALESTGVTALFARLEAGALTDDAFERECAGLLGLPPSRAAGLRRRLFAAMRADHAMRRAVFAARAGGVRTGLLSNSVGTGGYDPRTVADLFDVAVISRDEGVRKPDLAIYETALRRLDLPPHAVVFVDDLAVNLAPAASLGMETVHHRDAERTIPQLERLLGVRIPVGPAPATR